MLLAAALGTLALGLTPKAPPGPIDDLGPIVERLAGPDPVVRRLAQRDLSRALTGVGEAALLDAALAGAPTEAQRRVARVLGREPRLLGLAAELAASRQGPAARVGREAIEAHLARWSASAFDEPEVAVLDPTRQEIPLPDPWVDGSSLQLALDPVAGGVVAVFDRLDRWGGGPAPIILDPRVVTRVVRRPVPALDSTRLQGSWAEVLGSLCRLHGVAYQVQGYRYPGEQRSGDVPSLGAEGEADAIARPFVHVVPAGTTELAPVGVDLRARASDEIVRWCRDLVRDGDSVRQRAAATALASLDWPAAIQWLELRWLEGGDVPSLEGLLAAAARDRVAPCLQRPDVLSRILGIVDEQAAEVDLLRAAREAAPAETADAEAEEALREASRALDERAHRFAAGLAGIAPVAVTSESGGRSLVDVFLEGFEAAPSTGRWIRLAAIEGLGLESERAARAARRALTGEVEARSRRQALRTLLVTAEPGAEVILDDVTALFQEAISGAFGIGLELGLAGARPRDAAFVGSLSSDDQHLAELLIWASLVEGQGTSPAPWAVAAAKATAGRAGRRASLSRVGPLRRAAWGARGDVPRALGELCARLEPALAPRDRRIFEAAALAAGLADPVARARAFEKAKAALLDGPEEAGPIAVEDAWLALASLVGDPRHGREALSTLEGALVEALLDGRTRRALGSSTALARAAEQAADGLRRARRDVAAEDFADELRGAAGRGKHPLRDRFYGVDWPPPAPLPPRDLERLEPVLPTR